MTARAFSLIEVMVSAALLAAGLAAMLTAYNTSGRLLEHQRHTTVAINTAEQVMEELLLLPTGDPALAGGSSCADREGMRVPCDGTQLYTIRWEGVPHAALAGVLNLTVSALWVEGATAHARVLSMATQRS